MDSTTWWLAGVTLAVLALGGLVLRAELGRERAPAPVRRTEPAPPPGPAGASMPSVDAPTTALRPVVAAQLSDPPMVDGRTLRNWLVYQTRRDGVWSEVVAQFYERAAAVPEVADYFRNTDMETQQRHFTRALILVTHHGVTQRTLDNLADRHRRVLDSHGRPITPEVYETVIGTLVGVLREHQVPEYGIAELARTIAPFRAALVGGA